MVEYPESGRLSTCSPPQFWVALWLLFLAIAEYSKLEFEAFDCDADGILEKVEKKYAMPGIVLNATLKLKDENVKERAQRILEKAEAACLITQSIKSEVTLKINITYWDFWPGKLLISKRVLILGFEWGGWMVTRSKPAGKIFPIKRSLYFLFSDKNFNFGKNNTY